MTGDDIIAEAQLNFGEQTALTLATADWQGWLNTAVGELYALLPRAELLVLAETATVALVSGKGTLPTTLDHLVGVQVAARPAIEIPQESIEVIDGNAYLRPNRAVFASDGEHLWVRGSLAVAPLEATVTYIDPPAKITLFTAEVVLPKWHACLVLFVTAFAYAQEEDKGQAQHYRNEALALINRTATAPEQEAL